MSHHTHVLTVLALGVLLATPTPAVAQQPDAVWVHYRVGLIQAKAGDKDGARVSARRTVELAGGMDGELGTEYRRLGETLLASLDA